MIAVSIGIYLCVCLALTMPFLARYVIVSRNEHDKRHKAEREFSEDPSSLHAIIRLFRP